jgi:hypothetical protein
VSRSEREGSLLSFMNAYETAAASMRYESSSTEIFFLTQLFCQHERRNDGVLENSAKNRNSAHNDGRVASFARVPRARRFMSQELARGVSNGSRGLRPPQVIPRATSPWLFNMAPFRGHLQCRWKHHHGYSGTGCCVAGEWAQVTRANDGCGARAIVDERLQARTTLEEARFASGRLV